MNRSSAMRLITRLLLLAGLSSPHLLTTFSQPAQAANSEPAELTSASFWQAARVPFSFKYGGKDSAHLLPAWQAEQQASTTNGIAVTRYSFIDPLTRLKIVAEVRLFADFPGTVDWVLHFINQGKADTPILEDILPLDLKVAASPDTAVIRHDRGSTARADDFKPLEDQLDPGTSAHFESSSGDSSSGESLPFFNLESGDHGGNHGLEDHGLIAAIGWTGNWKADFHSDEDARTIQITSGMKKTHFLLHPGEQIRTPRIVLMSWTSSNKSVEHFPGQNWQDSQNAWRRLILEHYTPQSNGKPMPGPVLFGSWGSEPIADKIAYIDWVHQHKIPVDLYAVDAGWYGDSFGAEMDPTNPWWKNRGDWFPSKRYYPDGIRPLGDKLQSAGLGFSLWLEPETSMEGRKIITDHPDWFLKTDHPMFTAGFRNPGVRLADLGNPAALQGITELVTRFIDDYRVTWLRQDFNIPPERYWELKDTPDRIGMAEIRYIEGLYQLWDTLLSQHPGLRIDNCASGGRRLDIEMMSRSFAVWRTDYGFTDTLAEQAQTQALAYWVPENMGFESYTATKPWTNSASPPNPPSSSDSINSPQPQPFDAPAHLYLMRLGYNAGYGVGPGAAGVDNDAWIAWIKQAIAEYREVQPYFYGDFYPLLSYSLSADTWTATQWDRPEQQDGLIILLRRPQSPFPSIELSPKHLDRNATYSVEIRTSYQHAQATTMNGQALSHLQITLKDA